MDEKMKEAPKAQRLSDVDPLLVEEIQRNQTVRCIRKVMTALKIGPEEAVRIFQIPKKERKGYIAVLKNKKDEKKPKNSPAT